MLSFDELAFQDQLRACCIYTPFVVQATESVFSEVDMIIIVVVLKYIESRSIR
jgi:hypothetical protein